jgi:hypothetical protein
MKFLSKQRYSAGALAQTVLKGSRQTAHPIKLKISSARPVEAWRLSATFFRRAKDG